MHWLRALQLPGLATGLRSAWQAGYGLDDLRRDILAGLTVGVVAVPLAMALAIATGVPPQHGLYTAIVAGAIIAFTGGSRFNVSGPTAAFVVILFPIVKEFGLGGLMLATFMGGAILLVLGLCRLGALIRLVPYPVILGFTAGIAVVIATMQVPDFLGLETDGLSEHYVENLGSILTALGSINPLELAVGLFTLAVLLLWPRLKLPVPAPLVGLLLGGVVAWVINHWMGAGFSVDTIASRFTWEHQGQSGAGIPPILPGFAMPWHFPGPDGEPLVLNFSLFRALLGPALAIAMLGAIESLLCAVVSDSMTRTRHDPNGELMGQGLGNMVVPFFGGITATAAIARTATNVRSGARSPMAALVHSLVVLLSVTVLAGALSLVPMAALAALLFVVAWNMSEARHFVHTLRLAPRGDIAILLVCFVLTVFFDMVLAVAVGTGLASLLFMRRMAQTTRSDRVEGEYDPLLADLPREVALYDVNGPLFFGAADRAIASLQQVDPAVRVVVVDMRDVPSIDATAIAALKSLVDDMSYQNMGLIFSGLSREKVMKLRRFGLAKVPGQLAYCRDLPQAIGMAKRWLAVAP
ncbi:MAG: C4-dicarboxylic acid transporter DauA [Halomonadaceae bacterium]|nr:MAG: C4-dicarboxylic acid transporter DauA [Halomonadaceae bacterium]